MQTLAPDSFCPLTNPQPYQRDGDKPRQGVVANTVNLYRQGAVGSSIWLGLAMEQRGNVEPEDYLPNEDHDSHYRMRANAS